MTSENLDRETKLLEHIKSLPQEGLQGNPDKVLEEMDKFSVDAYNFMHIGANKGKIVIEQMDRKETKLMVELGTYVGYSAILFGKEVQKNLGKLYSLEINEAVANIAIELIEIAGLSDTVEVLVGPAAKSLEIIALKRRTIDIVFINHCVDFYLPNLRVLEALDLITPGTIITADNMRIPGSPEYHNYVNSTPEERRHYNAEIENVNGKNYVGKWNLLYKSHLVEVLTPRGDLDAVEITECLEYLY